MINGEEDLSSRARLRPPTPGMARLITHSPPPSRILSPSNIACSECVADCDDADCIAEIDGRCTDQCVIVPCDNPEHGDIQCPKGDCESTCGVPDACSLSGHPHAACDTFQHRGITCAQNGCSISTCEDPDNCSLVNATECVPPYRSQDITEHTFAPHTHSGDLEAALEAILCSCGVTSSHEDDTASHNFLRGSYGGPSPTLSTLTSPSETNSLPSTFNSPLPLPEYIPALYFTQQPASVVPPGHTCLWNGCGSSFSSLDDLITHVNISHLRAYSSQILEPVADLSSYMRLNPDGLELSCQWGNCHEYSSTPNSSSPSVDALNSLAGHLLHDHLGLQDGPGDHTATIANHITVPDRGLPIPVPDPAQDVEMRAEEQCSDNIHQGMPLARNAKQDEVDKSKDETTAEVKTPTPAVGVTEKCRWRGCERSFANVDDLMNHLTAVHVGSGKNHYECFWSGCERNGQNGFGSKQKVCRHLQMHTGHKPFQCKLCKQYFSEAATLQQHMRRHTQEKPYTCDFPGCGKAFAIAGALTIHRRTHMGLKPFKCTHCERAFSESSNLSKHLRTHTGVRPYVCDEPGCGKTFARPDQFSRHQRVHLKRNIATGPRKSVEVSQASPLQSCPPHSQ